MTFTDDFQRLHGFYHIESRARWIKVTIAEGINLDLLKKYQPEMQAAIDRFNGHRWGMHLWVQGDALLTPEATTTLRSVIMTRAQMGCCAVAIQIVEAVAPSLIQAYWNDLYTHSGMPYTFCQDEAQAEIWLDEHLTELV